MWWCSAVLPLENALLRLVPGHLGRGPGCGDGEAHDALLSGSPASGSLGQGPGGAHHAASSAMGTAIGTILFHQEQSEVARLAAVRPGNMDSGFDLSSDSARSRVGHRERNSVGEPRPPGEVDDRAVVESVPFGAGPIAAAVATWMADCRVVKFTSQLYFRVSSHETGAWGG